MADGGSLAGCSACFPKLPLSQIILEATPGRTEEGACQADNGLINTNQAVSAFQ
jgi:hypothetical protein